MLDILLFIARLISAAVIVFALAGMLREMLPEGG